MHAPVDCSPADWVAGGKGPGKRGSERSGEAICPALAGNDDELQQRFSEGAELKFEHRAPSGQWTLKNTLPPVVENRATHLFGDAGTAHRTQSGAWA